MRSLYYRSFFALVCALVIVHNVLCEEPGIRYLRHELKGDTRNLSKGKGGSSSSRSKGKGSIYSKSQKSSKLPGGKGGKFGKGKGIKSSKSPKSKGDGWKGIKSSKSPKSKKRDGKGSKSYKSYGKGKGSKSDKSSKSSKSYKGAKSSKSPKHGKSYKGGAPTSSKPDPPLTPSPTPGVGGKPTTSSPTRPPTKTSSPTKAFVITSAPTKAPVVSPPTICGRTEEERVAFITEIISGMAASNLLNDPNSPQGKAAQWLINDDPIALCPDSSVQIVQRFALAVFYYSTDGDRWSFCRTATGPCPSNAQRFLSDSSECEWFGIECNPSNGRVLSLRLDTLDGQDINLNGIIPPEVFLIPRIRDVRLYFTPDVNDQNNVRQGRLSGTIPATINQASQLRALDIDSQNISGEIPNEFYQSTLREVDLDNNSLTGTISSNVQNMNNLIFFTASDNPFDQQPIPVGFGNIPQLRFLGLNNANLVGPIPNSLSNLREIRAIDFSNNDLTGNISFLRNYNNLQSIALANNRLSGDIPAEFWQKNNLTIANLENNNLSGQIAPSIGSMTELRTLRLARNNMSGTIPVEMANLTNLRVLTLEGNNFTGDIPAELCALRFLEIITVPPTVNCPRICCVTVPNP